MRRKATFTLFQDSLQDENADCWRGSRKKREGAVMRGGFAFKAGHRPRRKSVSFRRIPLTPTGVSICGFGRRGVGETTGAWKSGTARPRFCSTTGRNLREIQELLRHMNIRTTVRHTHVGYEQTRQIAEALSQALESRELIQKPAGCGKRSCIECASTHDSSADNPF
jgi:hypothetical protein